VTTIKTGNLTNVLLSMINPASHHIVESLYNTLTINTDKKVINNLCIVIIYICFKIEDVTNIK